MNSEPVESSSVSTNSPTVALVDPSVQVRLKREGEQLQLILPKSEEPSGSNDWSEIWEQLKHRLNGGERFWQPGTFVHLLARDRLLDSRQLQGIAEALAGVDLKIERVYTSRRQTAVAAAMAGYSVEQQPPEKALAAPVASSESQVEPPLYLKSTVRSGVEIRHPGTIVIFGDMNPGSRAIAAGDILVLGRLRGTAHAGSQGDRAATIIALQMEATQLRIADILARVPAPPPEEFYPEVAFITPSGLRLAKIVNFFKTYHFAQDAKGWIESTGNTL